MAKLPLEDLKVQSFITDVKNNKVRGGGIYTTIDDPNFTVGCQSEDITHLCCGKTQIWC